MASSYSNYHPVDSILSSLAQEAVQGEQAFIANQIFETVQTPERSGTLLIEASRNFSITGDITAANVAFNGSANVTLNATLDNGTVTAAKLNTASTLNIRDSAGSVLKTINFPGA